MKSHRMDAILLIRSRVISRIGSRIVSVLSFADLAYYVQITLSDSSNRLHALSAVRDRCYSHVGDMYTLCSKKVKKEMTTHICSLTRDVRLVYCSSSRTKVLVRSLCSVHGFLSSIQIPYRKEVIEWTIN